MRLPERIRRRAPLTIVLMLAWYLASGVWGGMVNPTYLNTTFFVGACLVVLLVFTPAKMRAEFRLALAIAFLIGIYLVTKFRGGPFFRTEIVILGCVWVGVQLSHVIVAIWVHGGTSSMFALHVYEHGYWSAARQALRGSFGDTGARVLNAVFWGMAIMGASLLIWHSGWIENKVDLGLHQPQLHLTVAQTDLPTSITITLSTPDNNPHKYLETALQICRRLRDAGAVVTSFPRRGNLDSASQQLADSIAAAGGLTFPQLTNPAERLRPWSIPFYRYYPLDISWKYGKPAIHPGLVAAARYLHVPVKISPALLHSPSPHDWIDNPDGGSDLPHVNHDLLRLGDISIPFWTDGSSCVLSSHAMLGVAFWERVRGWRAGDWWDPTRFPADLEVPEWGAPLTYFDWASGQRTGSLPDSIWKLAAGKMVFVQWVNQGEDLRRDDATTPALVADMVVRGCTVDQLAPWHIALSCLFVLIGVVLSVRGPNWLLVVVMATAAGGVLLVERWLFSEYLLVGNMVYAACTAALTMVVLPLVSAGTRRRRALQPTIRLNTRR